MLFLFFTRVHTRTKHRANLQLFFHLTNKKRIKNNSNGKNFVDGSTPFCDFVTL